MRWVAYALVLILLLTGAVWGHDWLRCILKPGDPNLAQVLSGLCRREAVSIEQVVCYEERVVGRGYAVFASGLVELARVASSGSIGRAMC